MSKGCFEIEESDIVKFDGDGFRRGWVNIGTHAVLLELDDIGNLSVEVCARTNEGQPLETVSVTKESSVAAGGVEPNAK